MIFGLHPNAEIGSRSQASYALLEKLSYMSPSSVDASEEDKIGQHVAESVSQETLEHFQGIVFNVEDIVAACLNEVGPYQIVLLQVRSLCLEVQVNNQRNARE